jgi:hypothetical protein
MVNGTSCLCHPLSHDLSQGDSAFRIINVAFSKADSRGLDTPPIEGLVLS